MKTEYIASVLIISVCCNAAKAEAVCDPYLVEFWQIFSDRYGIDTVPAFLIKNGCIEGPSSIVKLYDSYQKLIDESFTTNEFLGHSYEEKYYVENYSEEAQRDQQANSLTHDQQHNYTSSTNYEDLSYINTEPDLDPEQVKISQDKIYQSDKLEPKKSVVHKPEKKYSFLALVSLTIMTVLFLIHNRRQKNMSQIKEKTCPDCGSKVKPGRSQCFVCGSYV